MIRDATPGDDATAARALSGELEAYRSGIEAIEAEARRLTHGLGPAQLLWRPEPGRWGVAECLAHLVITGETYLPAIDRCIAGAHQRELLGDGPFKHPRLGNLFMRLQEPPVKRRVRTFRRLTPAPELDVEAALEEFSVLQQRLRERLAAAEGLHLARTRLRSPVLPLLRFSLGQTFGIILAHERRHIWQAQQVRSARGFPQPVA